MIKDIHEKNSVFDEGTMLCSLFGCEMEVNIEKGVGLDYAEKCAAALETLTEEAKDMICERVSAFHQYMLDEWDDEFVAEINEKVPCDVRGREILKYIEEPKLYILTPQGEGTGYTIEGLCPWEPEHGIDIMMLDGEVRYVGTPEGYDPWSDDYDCDY